MADALSTEGRPPPTGNRAGNGGSEGSGGGGDRKSAAIATSLPPSRSRIQYACEACRASKIKCQPSAQANGICRRCHESRRECFFKTGPRKRRPRQSRKLLETATSETTTQTPPAPPGPSKTFTIDVPNPTEDDDPASEFDVVIARHQEILEGLTLSDKEGDEDSDHCLTDEPQPSHDTNPNRMPSTSSTFPIGLATTNPASAPVAALSSSSSPPSLPSLGGRDGPLGTTTPGGNTGHTSQGGGQGGGQAGTNTSRTTPQPRFNVDSAASLLATFRDEMLPHFPCVNNIFHPSPPPGQANNTHVRSSGFGDKDNGNNDDDGDDDDDDDAQLVARLARTTPFLLLAILSAASGSRTIQGHGLYDDEFRKALALKVVARGERSLELLQGLVIYLMWYPFHLKPKNRQAFQYIRMLGDLVKDLDLDQDPDTHGQLHRESLGLDRIDQIRTYLAAFFLASSFATGWGRKPQVRYTDYTAHCCDLLETGSPLRGDHVLAWQVRLHRLVVEAVDMHKPQRRSRSSSSSSLSSQSSSAYHIGLMLSGMEVQMAEWEHRMEPHLLDTPPIRLAILTTRIYLSGAPLIAVPMCTSSAGTRRMHPGTPTPSSDGSSSASASIPIAAANTPSTGQLGPSRTDPRRLMAAVPHLHALWDLFLALPPAGLNVLPSIAWGGLVMSVVVGFRMSFPLPDGLVLPGQGGGWDHEAARTQIQLGKYLERMCRMGKEGGGVGASGGGSEDTVAAAAAGLASSDSVPAACPISSAGKSARGSSEGDQDPGGGDGLPNSGREGQAPPEESTGDVKINKRRNLTMDVSGVSGLVLEIVKKKYENRLVQIERQEQRRRRRRRREEDDNELVIMTMMAAAPSLPLPAAVPFSQAGEWQFLAAGSETQPGFWEAQQQQQQQTATTAGSAGFDHAQPDQMQLDSSMGGCPMIDGSLERFYPGWDNMFAPAETRGGDHLEGSEQEDQRQEEQQRADMWTTMTMNWAGPDFGLGGF